MSAFQRFRLFLFPKPWARCTPPTEAERLADYELRLGAHRAAQRIRNARVSKQLDLAATVRPAFHPRLPG